MYSCLQILVSVKDKGINRKIRIEKMCYGYRPHISPYLAYPNMYIERATKNNNNLKKEKGHLRLKHIGLWRIQNPPTLTSHGIIVSFSL